jgi:hypothetical protein
MERRRLRYWGHCHLAFAASRTTSFTVIYASLHPRDAEIIHTGWHFILAVGSPHQVAVAPRHSSAVLSILVHRRIDPKSSEWSVAAKFIAVDNNIIRVQSGHELTGHMC